MASKAIALAALVALGGCAHELHRFALREPMTIDEDSRPFAPMPKPYVSPYVWDFIDQSALRPLSRFFAVDPSGPAGNVNSLDEVPASSWFHDRLGVHPLTSAELADGACVEPKLTTAGPWIVVSAKPNGADPGFIMEDAKKQRYFVKFDDKRQPERATAADVIGSRIYWAAGYNVPCNTVVIFKREVLKVDPKAKAGKVPLTEENLDKILAQATRLPDGRYRAMASLALPGKMLGPFTYTGVRDDDDNDVVAHEDRRDLRGADVLAAWLNHFDAREQNTLDAWIGVPGGTMDGGYLRHNQIDWGDCLGFLSEQGEATSRRIGFAYYADFGVLFGELFTLGIPERPWDTVKYGPLGESWGYYDVETFDPASWVPGYPNPAFLRMTERDAAWMARIVARFTDDDLAVIVDQAQLSAPARALLIRVLAGRRDKILRRWLGQLSALTAPHVESGELCLDDLAVIAHVAPITERRYAARSWKDDGAGAPLQLRTTDDGRVCTPLPAQPDASAATPRYLIVDVDSFAWGRGRVVPARVHLYDRGGGDFLIVGLERPDDDDSPYGDGD